MEIELLISRWKIRLLISACLIVFIFAGEADSEKIIYGIRKNAQQIQGDNSVFHKCVIGNKSNKFLSKFNLTKPWLLQGKNLAGTPDTINVLILRYNFQFEDVDDQNTTGRGTMDLSPFDSVTLIETVGHIIDPPPHNSAYFNSHLRALKEYYEIVSDNKLSINWEIYPPQSDSVYTLPYPMNHYGQCDLDNVVVGLENYFRDCIRLADTSSPEIEFDKYQSIILFHAGSDRQNDIGNPETCSDLFTGFIKYNNLDSVLVDNDSVIIDEAIIMPEFASQDNRVVALNAVLAHEFGHQLGLVDLYNTSTFLSQLGDFALMDNNGFATGIDFGFPAGNVFGAVPLFPSAWSRAFLGFTDIVDFRQGSDIRIVAAEMITDGFKIARIPISEKEYYLLENRIQELDGISETGVQIDSLTNVILGPAYRDPSSNLVVRSREYDVLMPGSGVLIYHVDEKTAELDYDYDGENNFDDNQLQWIQDINGRPINRFISLVEADGLVNFGGFYLAGFGRAEDMFRDDRNNSFTPNSNPRTFDNTGNNTHIYMTDIGREIDDSQPGGRVDSVILFDLETEDIVMNFPVRAGLSNSNFSPIADDLNNDGIDEIIIVADSNLSVVSLDGNNFLNSITACNNCPIYYDSSIITISNRQYELPLYAKLPGMATSQPVTGSFLNSPDTNKYVAIGTSYIAGSIAVYKLEDGNLDNQADTLFDYEDIIGSPIAMTFGDTSILYVLTDSGYVYSKNNFIDSWQRTAIPFSLDHVQYHNITKVGQSIVVVYSLNNQTYLYYVYQNDIVDSYLIEGNYNLGPVICDMNLDGIDELILISSNGDIATVELTSNISSEIFDNFNSKSTGFQFTVNPVVADVDLNGFPEIIIGGVNSIFAFDNQFTLVTSFPIEINDIYPQDLPTASPIVSDIQREGKIEIIIPTEIGNLYSYGLERSFGFPLPAGENLIGSPLFVNDEMGGKLGYLGSDGWFYLWYVDLDTNSNFWPMSGADPSGSYYFNKNKLGEIVRPLALLPEEKYYNYPNPVIDGNTTIRYYLGADANSVVLYIYDFNGQEIARLNGPTVGLADNEIEWNCTDVTPGVYRCIIKAEFNNSTEKAFTDIAVIR